jgi:type I restriction enzyme R subunit
MDLDDQTDPNNLYDLQNNIDAHNIIYSNDVEAYADIFFKKGDHKEKLQPILNDVVTRFTTNLNEEEQLSLKAYMRSFVRLYRFLAQIITFTDVQLEKYYVFLTDLQKKLPLVKSDLPFEVLEEIDLDSYRIQHQFTQSLQLESSNTPMEGMTAGGGIIKDPEGLEWLTKIIKVLNETYGLELVEEDKVEFERMRQNIYANEELMSFFMKKHS